MIDLSQSKTCPLCAETIKAAARLCPFCRAHQSRFALWREQLGQVVFSLLLLAILCLVGCWVAPEDDVTSGRSFARHRKDLRVVQMSLERSKTKSEFWLTGYVTNSGTYPWRVHEFELRLLDARGNLLDVRHPTVSDPFVVPSGGENAFRVGLGDLVFTNSGVTHQVRVQSATDGNLPAKSY